MAKSDLELLKEALRKQRQEVKASPQAAIALLKELGLVTKGGNLKRSVTPIKSRVSR